ncbi:MAG: hypothetical protein SF339_30220 [Blastocatellia bacterium]|nr:hypothetical protein [Blastocatellia bacterium]
MNFTGDPRARQRAERGFAIGLSALLLCATLWPLRENWRENPRDSFPLSYFPMFSDKRGETYEVTHLVGVAGNGERRKIRHTYAGTGGFNQVRRQIRKTVRRGRAAELCRSVADRVARVRRGELAEVAEVRVVTGEYGLNSFFAGNQKPVAEEIHAVCNVERNR